MRTLSKWKPWNARLDGLPAHADSNQVGEEGAHLRCAFSSRFGRTLGSFHIGSQHCSPSSLSLLRPGAPTAGDFRSDVNVLLALAHLGTSAPSLPQATYAQLVFDPIDTCPSSTSSLTKAATVTFQVLSRLSNGAQSLHPPTRTDHHGKSSVSGPRLQSRWSLCRESSLLLRYVSYSLFVFLEMTMSSLTPCSFGLLSLISDSIPPSILYR